MRIKIPPIVAEKTKYELFRVVARNGNTKEHRTCYAMGEDPSHASFKVVFALNHFQYKRTGKSTWGDSIVEPVKDLSEMTCNLI